MNLVLKWHRANTCEGLNFTAFYPSIQITSNHPCKYFEAVCLFYQDIEDDGQAI